LTPSSRLFRDALPAIALSRPAGVEEGHMNSFTADGERVLSVHTVATRLGVSDRTVRFWAEKGWLRGFKDGPKIWRFRETDVEAARARLASRRRHAAGAGGDSSDDP
jgi:excisionase family DNA binding protein